MDFQKAVELIDKSSDILLTTHTHPDGDACGSIVAISDTLTALGKKIEPIFLSPAPQWYEFLFDEKVPILGQDITVEQLKQGQLIQPDLVMIIDTNSFSQLPRFDQYLKQSDKPVLVIDHHITADGLGDIELTDTSAAATGLIVLDLLKYAQWPVTEKIARALFVAVAVAVKPQGQADPGDIYNRLYTWILKQNYIPTDSPREVFLTNAMAGDYAQMETEIMFPIQKPSLDKD